MRKLFIYFVIVSIMVLLVQQTSFSEPGTDLSKANEIIVKAIDKLKAQDIDSTRKLYEDFNKEWVAIEDGIKKESKQAYGDIEEKIGMVQFLLSQNPIQNDRLLEALEDLSNSNQSFIKNSGKSEEIAKPNGNITVKDLLLQLQKAKKQASNRDISGALKTMDEFSSTWLQVEGVILTQSQKVYTDAEKDMVAVKAYLKTGESGVTDAIKVMDAMVAYITPLASKASYTMLDAVTIILREGLEALLVVIALLAFLRKSGNQNKKGWIYGGVGVGLGVSVILAVIVQLVFTSGTFGNNNFLIGGYTGVFAAVMLIYMSYWLHSKSNVEQWQSYIKDKGSKALATGGLFSLGLLAFLAVFREGTEIVLFYIGMASSIGLTDLLLGIGLGIAVLVIIAFLMLKVGVSIPIRPFFLVSSLLVFYLGLKFTGMGVNSLQLAGILSASTNGKLPSIAWLGMYPSWEVFIPQILMIIFAVLMISRDFFKKNQKTNQL